MGWGGILGAMTQGLGTGIVKNVEQGWKDEETQKLLDWKTAEADKQRAFDSELLDKKYKHEFELEDHRTRNEISAAAAKARISARYSHSGESEAQKNLLGATQTLGIYDSQLHSLQEKLSATEDKEQQNAIAARINAVSAERENYLKRPDTIAAFKGAGQMGQALYMTGGGDMDLYEPKEAAKEVKATVSSVAAPAINSNNASKLASNIALQIAKQNQDAIDHIKFNKASEEAKEWAARQGQYKQTFIPRTF